MTMFDVHPTHTNVFEGVGSLLFHFNKEMLSPYL